MTSIKRIFHVPIVVTTVLEKKRDCPKLQFGSPETFLAAETPLLLAFTISSIRLSKSSSETIVKFNHELQMCSVQRHHHEKKNGLSLFT